MGKATVEMIKDLRIKTGAGIMDCRDALVKSDGDSVIAEQFIKEKRKELRLFDISESRSGIVHSYIHTGSRIGVLVEVECGTDFAAKTDEFKTFVHDLAMHIAALNPTWISPEETPWEGSESEDIDSSRYLLLQPFIKDVNKTIEELLTELSDRIGERCTIKRFARFEVGEKLLPETISSLDKPKGPFIAVVVLLLIFLAVTFGVMLFA